MMDKSLLNDSENEKCLVSTSKLQEHAIFQTFVKHHLRENGPDSASTTSKWHDPAHVTKAMV